MKNLKWILGFAAILAVVAVIFYFAHGSSGKSTNVKIDDARIVDIRPMVRLLSMELYEDLPVKGSIGTRHIFARETLEGTIGFDLEKISQNYKGDTLVVVLPPEIVEVRESTAKDSYRVIDTWNEKFLGSSNFTAEEENKIKELARKSWIDSIYARGYVERARREARANLEGMLTPLVPGKVVRVEDPTPHGTR